MKLSKDNLLKESLELEETKFDGEIEGYSSCGSGAAQYKCKKDCIFVHSALISAIK